MKQLKCQIQNCHLDRSIWFFYFFFCLMCTGGNHWPDRLQFPKHVDIIQDLKFFKALAFPKVYDRFVSVLCNILWIATAFPIYKTAINNLIYSHSVDKLEQKNAVTERSMKILWFSFSLFHASKFHSYGRTHWFTCLA